jgi:hypothetical protein
MDSINEEETDADLATVLGILDGVHRGPRDPDAALLKILGDLDRSPERLPATLSALVRDAHTDR